MIMLHLMNCVLDKRVFLSHMRFATQRTHEETLIAADQVSSGEYQDINGVIGKSAFFAAKDFDVIDDIPPEPMHLLDGGFGKAILSRTFNSGTSQQSEPGYRRTSIAELTSKIEYVMLRSFRHIQC